MRVCIRDSSSGIDVEVGIGVGALAVLMAVAVVVAAVVVVAILVVGGEKCAHDVTFSTCCPSSPTMPNRVKMELPGRGGVSESQK